MRKKSVQAFCLQLFVQTLCMGEEERNVRVTFADGGMDVDMFVEGKKKKMAPRRWREKIKRNAHCFFFVHLTK